MSKLRRRARATPAASIPADAPESNRSGRRTPTLVRTLCLVGLALLTVVLVVANRSVGSLTTSNTSKFAVRQPQVYSAGMNSSYHCPKKLLSREKLDSSLALGMHFLMSRQHKDGRFDYEYDWRNGYNSADDHEVRQACATWALSLIFHDMMVHAEAEGVLSSSKGADKKIKLLKRVAFHTQKALSFFRTNSKVIQRDGSGEKNKYPRRMRYLTYPGGTVYHQGTQAIVCLALIDYLRALGSPLEAAAAGVTLSQIEAAQIMLDEMLPFLVTQHSGLGDNRFKEWDTLVKNAQKAMRSGSWYGTGESNSDMIEWWMRLQNMTGAFMMKFDDNGKRIHKFSSYYNGESLLVVVKAAKYLGPNYKHLLPFAAGAARALHQSDVVDACEKEKDSPVTKGIYGWMSMSLFELASVNFGEGRSQKFHAPLAVKTIFDQDQFGKWLVDMALWMIDTHRVLDQGRNTAYAFEGLVSAYSWASHAAERDHDNDMAVKARKIECVIEKGLNRLISWQVGMGAENNTHGTKWDGIRGLGGIQNTEVKSPLRIDVTQHQMDATILARRLAYLKVDAEWPWDPVILK